MIKILSSVIYSFIILVILWDIYVDCFRFTICACLAPSSTAMNTFISPINKKKCTSTRDLIKGHSNDSLQTGRGKKKNKSTVAGGDETLNLMRWRHVLYCCATTTAWFEPTSVGSGAAPDWDFCTPPLYRLSYSAAAWSFELLERFSLCSFFQRDLFTIFSLPVVENYFNEIGFQFGNQVRKSG